MDVKCFVAIIHSVEDEMIPYKCSWINYNSIPHSNKMHIKIKGGHSSPNIKSEQLLELFNFCDLSLSNMSSDVDISEMLENLRTYAEKHNNFMSL